MLSNGIIIFLSLTFVFVVYRYVINSYEWNRGKCPHCKDGIWLREEEAEFKCTHCGKHLFKL